MKTIWLWLFIFIVISAICTESLAAGTDDDRLIRINVHVRDFRGTPLEQVLLGVFDGTTTLVDGLTDQHGHISFVVELPLDITRVEIKPAFARESSFTHEEQVAIVQQMATWAFTYAAERYFIELERDKQVYIADIVLFEAVTIRGIIIDKDEEPIGQLVLVRQAAPSDARGRRPFLIRGVRKGAKTTLLVALKRQERSDSTTIVPIHLTEEQTQKDLDLGAIVVDVPERDSSADIFLSNFEGVLSPNIGVTLIRMDGTVLFAVAAFDERHERAGEAGGNPVKLPSGDYYVLPGHALFTSKDAMWTVVEALRDDRNIDEFGIHMITVEKDKHQRFNFDLAELYVPIRKMMEEEGRVAIPREDS